MNYHHLFTEFNVGTARQACLNAEVRMRTEYYLSERRRLESECGRQAELLKARDGEIENLKAQLLKSVALKDERDSLNGKITELQSSVSAKHLELKDVNVIVSSLKSQNKALWIRYVHALETTCSCLRDQLDADLLEMALHLEEKFYPHFLTTISGRMWLLTRGLKLVVFKCLNSLEYLAVFGAAISRAIEKGMQSGLGIDHSKEGKSLADVVAYNPAMEADFYSALQRLCEVDFPLIAELNSHKDASVKDVMNLLCLESPLAIAPGMSDLQPDVEQLMLPIHRSKDQVVLGKIYLSFSLSVSDSQVERIRKSVAEQRSSLANAMVPLVDPLSMENLTGAVDTSVRVPTTTAVRLPFPLPLLLQASFLLLL
ncbi:hypothetical protein Tco_0971794 [Tanacetum coccineum]